MVSISVYESSEWPSIGIFSGMTTHLGNYDECLLVSMHNIKGKYCLVQGTYNFSDLIGQKLATDADEWPSDELSVWEVIKMVSKNDFLTHSTIFYRLI